MEFSLKGLSDKAIKVLEIVKYIGVAVVSFLIYHQYLFFGELYGMISYTNHTNHTIKEAIIVKAPKGKYAWTATVGEKGQIVIPKQARDIFHIKPGDTILLLGDEKRGIAIPPKGAFAHLMEAAFEEKEDD